jgi:hypothetical protein
LKPPESRIDLSIELDVGGIIDDAMQPLAFDLLSGVTLEPTGERGYGFIAQDVYELFPSAVSVGHGDPGEQDFRPGGMDNSKLVVLLFAEVKSLRARLNALEGGE